MSLLRWKPLEKSGLFTARNPDKCHSTLLDCTYLLTNWVLVSSNNNNNRTRDKKKERERSGISRRIVCVCASPLTVRDEMNREVRAIAYSTSNSSANSSRVSSSKDEGKFSSSLSLFHMFSWMLLLVYILNNVRRRRPGERERTDNNSMACSAVHKKETRHGPTAKPIFIIIKKNKGKRRKEKIIFRLNNKKINLNNFSVSSIYTHIRSIDRSCCCWCCWNQNSNGIIIRSAALQTFSFSFFFFLKNRYSDKLIVDLISDDLSSPPFLPNWGPGIRALGILMGKRLISSRRNFSGRTAPPSYSSSNIVEYIKFEQFDSRQMKESRDINRIQF